MWWTSNCLDYQQSLFFLSPSNKTRENAHVRDWRRETGKAQKRDPERDSLFFSGCRPRFSRLVASPLDALSRAWLTEERKRDCSQSTETRDATNRCDTSPRQVAPTNRLVWHVKIIVAETEFRRCDLSHKFKLVWIRATCRSDKLSASNLSQQ